LAVTLSSSVIVKSNIQRTKLANRLLAIKWLRMVGSNGELSKIAAVEMDDKLEQGFELE
jgi:hypothetical protein